MIRAGRFGFLDVRFAVSLFADRVSFDFGSIMSCCLRLVFLEKERELKKKSFHIFRWLSWLAAKLVCIRRCWWWCLWWWLRCCCFCNDDDLVSFLSRGEVVLSFNGKTATLFFSRTSSFSFLFSQSSNGVKVFRRDLGNVGSISFSNCVSFFCRCGKDSRTLDMSCRVLAENNAISSVTTDDSFSSVLVWVLWPASFRDARA